VALATSKGIVAYDSELTGPRDIIEHINNMGFDAELAADHKHGNELDHSVEIQR
jgi:hypothetical protein